MIRGGKKSLKLDFTTIKATEGEKDARTLCAAAGNESWSTTTLWSVPLPLHYKSLQFRVPDEARHGAGARGEGLSSAQLSACVAKPGYLFSTFLTNRLICEALKTCHNISLMGTRALQVIKFPI